MTTMTEANRIADNAYLKLTSRVAMVLASAVGIPFALWILMQTYGTLNDLKEFQIETKVLLQTVQLEQQAGKNDQQDLSSRVRNLEEDSRTLQRVQGEILRIIQSAPMFQNKSIEPPPARDLAPSLFPK